MQKIKNLLRLLIQDLDSYGAFGSVALLFITYVLISLFAIGFRPAINILGSKYPLFKTIQILEEFFIELGLQTFSLSTSVLFFLTALLFALNIHLLLRRVKFLSSQRNVKVTIGAGVISVVANGCSACGLSILSVLGLSGAFLSVHGPILSFFAVGILLATLFYNLDAVNKSCPLPPRKID